jgi:hypothetical protein
VDGAASKGASLPSAATAGCDVTDAGAGGALGLRAMLAQLETAGTCAAAVRLEVSRGDETCALPRRSLSFMSRENSRGPA